MAADLTKRAALTSMFRLGKDETLEFPELPGHEPSTPAEVFAGRNGYNPDFVTGWRIRLPHAGGNRAADMRTLRRGGNGVELKYRNFSVIMSASRRLPMITATNINGAESRRIPRINAWSFDGRLDPEDQWGDLLYYKHSLDRGHMVRREDPVWGDPEIARQANQDTFHFTNSCPQIAGVNQKTWLSLENYILQHARVDSMKVSVFTGPFFSDRDLEHSTGARIPLAFWKVVAIVTEDGRPSATAYKVSQERELGDLEFVYAGYKTYQISVRQVMIDTGIDFGELVEYDGFSQHELGGGGTMIEKLESLANVRI